MYRPPKPLEELAVNLLFKSHGESRYNRTPAEYQRLALLVTNLKDAYYRVNKGLKEQHAAGNFEDAAICDFKAEIAILIIGRYRHPSQFKQFAMA